MSVARSSINKAFHFIQTEVDKSLFVASHPYYPSDIETLVEYIVRNKIKNVIAVKDSLIPSANPRRDVAKESLHCLDVASLLEVMNGAAKSVYTCTNMNAGRVDVVPVSEAVDADSCSSVAYGIHEVSLSSKHKQAKDAPIIALRNTTNNAVYTFQVHFFESSDLSKDQNELQRLAGLFRFNIERNKPLLIMQSNVRNTFHYCLVSAFAVFKEVILGAKDVHRSKDFLTRFGIPSDYKFRENHLGGLDYAAASERLLSALQALSLVESQKKARSPSSSPTPLRVSVESKSDSKSSIATPSSGISEQNKNVQSTSQSPAPRQISVSSLKSGQSDVEAKTPSSTTSIGSRLAQAASSPRLEEVPTVPMEVYVPDHFEPVMAREEKRRHAEIAAQRLAKSEQERKQKEKEAAQASSTKLAITSFSDLLTRAGEVAVDVKKKVTRKAKEVKKDATEVASEVSVFVKAIPIWDFRKP